MKNKFIYLLVVMLIGIMACNDEFTDPTAVGALSAEALQNETGVDLLLTGAYSLLDGERQNGGGPDWSESGDNWWLDVISDDAHKGSEDSDAAELFTIEALDWSPAYGYFKGKWLALYAGVNRCNAVLDVISKIEGTDFSAKEAEARFLRAHFNFELQKVFGNPAFISLENFQATEFNQPNSGPIWDKIEADFQFAIENLPEESTVGRPTSWSAKAFLGKVKLFQSHWGEALTLFNDVIANGPYVLIPEFADNFRIGANNSGRPESVFTIQFDASGGGSFNGNRGGTLNFPQGGPFGSCCGFYQPTQDLVNAFQTGADGLPLLNTFNQTDVAHDFGINSDEPFTLHTGPLDPRLDYTVGRRGIDYNGWGIMPGKEWIRGAFTDSQGPYLPKKNIYTNGDEDNRGTGAWGQQRSGVDYHIMRYADVLLMAAEAAVETNDLPTAMGYINQVRKRAKDMTYVAGSASYKIELYTTLGSQENARKAVRMERRLELGMEGHRWFDINRWSDGADIMNAYYTNEGRAIPTFAGDHVVPYSDKFKMIPIPTSAIDLSQGILTQNPGF